jgi:hypothetical protein
MKKQSVHRQFTYRELSLIAGIIVALIIVVTLWFNPLNAQSDNHPQTIFPVLKMPGVQSVSGGVVKSFQELSR